MAREQAGLTQGQAARLLGLHRPSVTEMEAGRRGVTADELGTLADTYGVSVAWLLDGEAGDVARVRYEMAARRLSNLKEEDIDELMQLLASLKQKEGGK